MLTVSTKYGSGTAGGTSGFSVMSTVFQDWLIRIQQQMVSLSADLYQGCEGLLLYVDEGECFLQNSVLFEIDGANAPFLQDTALHLTSARRHRHLRRSPRSQWLLLATTSFTYHCIDHRAFAPPHQSCQDYQSKMREMNPCSPSFASSFLPFPYLSPPLSFPCFPFPSLPFLSLQSLRSRTP